MTFNIFDSPTKDGIDVGYISSDRGYVTNVSICEANTYAKSNPGTVFIVKNRDFVKYLDINEVNKLVPSDLIPAKTDDCAGYENEDGGIDLEYEPVCGTSVHFYGGGGVGAYANPIVGSDGAVLAVDVVRGGFGYQYPPLVDIKDTCGVGVGAKGEAFISEKDITIFKYYDDEDEENYELCDDDTPGFGRRYSPDGKDLGPWDPEIYRKEAEKTPYEKAVDEYNKLLAEYTKPWKTGRSVNPSAIIWNTSSRTSKEKYDVTHENWSDFMNKYAISPVPASNVVGSDFGNETFTLEWDIDFPTEGEYIFRGLYDGAERFGDFYVDNQKIGNFKKSDENPEEIKKIYKKGLHKLKFDLKNNTFKKPGIIQPNVSTSGTTNTNTKEEVRFEGLNPANNPIIVASNGKELRLKDGDGNDANARFIITSGNAVFSADGRSIEGSGDAILRLEWNDRERTAGVAIQKIRLGDKVWTRVGRSGNETHTIAIGKTKTTYVSSYGDDIPASSIEIRSIFNTKDYIDKANRELWKLNNVTGFLNVYGITPFDPSGTYSSDKAGVHTITWSTITFPVSANYKIEIQVDDNVRLRIGDKVDIDKQGFSVRGDGRTATGKSTYTRFIERGTYQIIADVEQVPGGTLAYTSNVIALGINIETEVVEEEVLDSKSWNENPLGLALSIESPLPLPPVQAIPTGEGHCPPNPIWSTRFPGSTEVWHPVVGFPFWSKFLNQYALSPLPPLSASGTDGTGVVYRNTWTINLPYAGEYTLKGAVDNWGRILIDGTPYQRFSNEDISSIASDGSVNGTLAGPTQKKQPTSKIQLTEGQHEITVEVENWKDYETPRSFIDKKIFSTKDWQSPNASRTITYADVTFKVSSSSDNANRITMNDVFEFSKVRKGPQINQTATRRLERGKIYNVNLTGRKLKTKGESVLVMEDSRDEDYNDLICTSTVGRFYDIEGTKCKFMIDSDTTTESVRNGVVYKGPALFHYRNTIYGSFMSENSISPDYPRIGGGELVDYTWSNIDFPEDGEYEFRFQNDHSATLFLDGQKIASNTFIGQAIEGRHSVDFTGNGRVKLVKVNKGKHTLSVKPTVYTEASGGPIGFVDALFRKPTPDYYKGSAAFDSNPSAFAIGISIREETFPVAGSNDERLGKSWEGNPTAISAILIPAPCEQQVNGKGVVTRVDILDPGNGFPSPPPTGIGTGYPVALKLVDIVPTDSGIGYTGGVGIGISPDNGAKFKPIVDPFGRITGVTTVSEGIGFTEPPDITVPSPTGVNARFRPVFEVVRDPLDVRPDQLIQVTDLVGLKQTGYYDGRPYYGSVFYRDGIRYAGQYQTAGDLIQVYDTLQESIDARITTPPSAILRQGTDTNSNNPRLNIPDTPENLT